MNKRYGQILDSAAGLHIPDDLDLFPKVAARLNQRRTLMQTLRARPALAILLAILVLLLMTGVVYAIGRSLGYIPGVGLVDRNAPVRALAGPVSVSRDGVTVTIVQVVVDPERTVIVYKAEGLTIEAANSKGEGGGPFGSADLLRLPDGTVLNQASFTGYGGTPEPLIGNLQAEGGWPNYVWRLVYPPVPPEVKELTLLIPVLQNMPRDAAPENWEITFDLKPASPDMGYIPIMEITPQPAAATPSTAAGAAAASNTAALNGFTLTLNNVIQAEDGYVFTGNLSWSDSVFPTGKGMIAGAVIPTLTDSDGRNIPIEEVQVDAPYDPHNIPWSYRTNQKAFVGPLVFSIPAISTTYEAPPIDFQLDLGSDPQIGQSWELTHDFQIEGHTVRLLSVEMGVVPKDCQGASLNFKFSADVPGILVNVGEVVPQTAMLCSERTGGGGGGGGPFDPSILYSGITYKDIPGGIHHFSLNASVPYTIPGPWQITWDPPVTSEPVPAAGPEACLTLDKWNQLAARNDALPAGVGGRIVTTVNEGGMLPVIYVSSLDGANSQKIGTGAWPSLSGDGSRLVYSSADGLHVVDLGTGQNSSLGTDGYRIIWSPDHARIMYTTTSALHVVNADGSDPRIVDTGPSQVISPVGWLPDNQTVVYSALAGDGFDLKSYSLQSGETKALFAIHNKAGYGAISPDGKWIVFADRVFGDTNWSIFIARVDGSERKLVAEPQVQTAFTSVWGPDGQWLILKTLNTEGIEIPILVNPFTCQVLHPDTIHGSVEGWGP